MFNFIQEELTSPLSPYLSYLFSIIKKQSSNKATFLEWMPTMIIYCLYPNEKMKQFVLQMLDDDHDEVLSKKDIIKFLVMERYGQKIYPYNYVKAIELLDVERSD